MTGRRGLSLLLWAVALHSALVGIGLMAAPPALLERFGFGTVSQRFFPVQGGVFHLVMVMFYVTAARAPERHRDLVRLAVATKTLAFVFLASYFFAVERIVTVLLSGVADGAMAAAIAALAARAKG
ncbi:MAG: hypothetical protein R3C71_09500 [Candidatus Krumholzibacteriia bacterium]|nr:hypothetical protein [bacterium]MCB9514457.1 hypothetical protein [Candidatus Latescibacterota bacterium]MCB9517261.1 hypothetical protein [Candidatus Latescibacterota bacterium]